MNMMINDVTYNICKVLVFQLVFFGIKIMYSNCFINCPYRMQIEAKDTLVNSDDLWIQTILGIHCVIPLRANDKNH